MILKIALSVIAVGAIGLSLSLRYYQPMSGWLLIAIGKAPDCAGWSGYSALNRRLRFNDAERQLLRVSRTIKTDGDLKLTETPQGSFWEPIGDSSIVVSQLAELQSKYSGGHPVRSGDTVIDCGANVGTWTASALRAGAKLVAAVEPDPMHVECLRRNLRSDIEAGRVVLIPKGVWSHEDRLVLRQAVETSARNSFVETEKTRPGLTLPVTTLDAIVQQLGLSRVDFIKMDIEGSEPKALAGAITTLARWHPHMELEVSHGNQAELLAAARKGWSRYRSECLVCFAIAEQNRIVPHLLSLHD